MLEILSRDVWNAERPKYRNAMYSFAEGWIAHYLGPAYSDRMTDIQVLQSVQRYHMHAAATGWSDIAYSFAIGQDGTVYELRGWGIAGGHTSYRGGAYGRSRYNKNAMGVLYLVGQGEDVPDVMFESFERLMLVKPEYPRGSIRGHQDVESIATSCPGPVILTYTRTYRDEAPVIHSDVTKELAEAMVNSAYTNILRRDPLEDLEGRNYWASQIVLGTVTRDDVRWEFVYAAFGIEKDANRAANAALLARRDISIDLEQVRKDAEEAAVTYMQEVLRKGLSLS